VKVAETNKGAFVAELVRDMYNVHYARKNGLSGVDYIQHVIVETPDDPDLQRWVRDIVETVGRKFEEK